MATNPNQKGGEITGAAVNKEVLASSKSIHDKTQGGGTKGLQQWYTPPEAAKLIQTVIGPRPSSVFDPTAGDGSLLREWEPDRCYGVEIDPDQVENSNGGYTAITGDFQQVYPLLRRVVSFEAIVMNPPFGLEWEIPSLNNDKPGNSTLLTLQAAKQLLTDDGQWVLIGGTGRINQHILGSVAAAGAYAVVDVADLFEGTTLPSSIVFGINPELLGEDEPIPEPVRREINVENLDLLATWVREERQKHADDWYFNGTAYRSQSIRSDFQAINAEHKRRLEKRLGAEESGDDKELFDVTLYGGDRIQSQPSPYTQLMLRRMDKLHIVSRLDGAPVSYFIQNEREWTAIKELEADKLITIHPRVHEEVEKALEETYRVLCPLYPVAPAQRLGFLSDISQLKCIKDDPELGFEAGVRYDLSTRSQTVKEHETRAVQIQAGKRAGEWEDRNYTIARKVMQITVGRWTFTDSEKDSENIQRLIEHFELPDPGDVSTRFPEETEAMRKLLAEVQDEVFVPNSTVYSEKHPELGLPIVRFLPKQIEDLSRMMVKGSGMVAWEQGSGKTIAGCGYAEAAIRGLGAQDAVLIIAPGDLIPQWQREVERLCGRKLEHITDQAQAKKIAKALRRGGTGWYITHPEALSIAGTRRSIPMPVVTVEEKEVHKTKPGTDRYGFGYRTVDAEGNDRTEPIARKINWYHDENATLTEDDQTNGYVQRREDENGRYGWKFIEPDGSERDVIRGYIPAQIETSTKAITSKELCPSCKADRQEGWNGLYCEREMPDGSTCGYAHYSVRVKPVASFLSVAFKKGVIILDEATKMQGEQSKMSLAIRGLRARHKLAMTGTPIKNYVKQAFWPMWWALGNGSARFPYGYDEQIKFEENFCVFESYTVASDGKTRGAKSLPEVTNLSLFWRLIASSIIRRRLDELGVPVPPVAYHPVHVPLGSQQRLSLNKWAKCFVKWFIETHPESKISAYPDLVEKRAKTLGLAVKFEYAEVLPEGDPSNEWVPDENDDPMGEFQEIAYSNFTPAALKVMELAMGLVKQGRKVLIGSPLMATGKFLADELQKKDVKAVHILDGAGKTQSKEKRAKTVHAFQTTDNADVLCTTVQAIRLGHNLDAGSAVILLGLPWDFETLDQFVKRVRRMSSRRPIDVYVVIPGEEGITAKKWELLNLKGQAAELALDGHIVQKTEIEISAEQIIADLINKGVSETGDELDESQVELIWEKLESLDEYEVPETLLAEVDPNEELAAWAAGSFIYWNAKRESVTDATKSVEVPPEPDFLDSPKVREAVAWARENGLFAPKTAALMAEPEDDGHFVCEECGDVFGPDEGDGDACADCLYEIEQKADELPEDKEPVDPMSDEPETEIEPEEEQEDEEVYSEFQMALFGGAN